MKYANSTLKTLTILMLALFALAFVGCESDKINNLAGPDQDSHSSISPAPLNVNNNVVSGIVGTQDGNSGTPGNSGNGNGNNFGYPQSTWDTFKYRNRGRGYNGGNMNVPGGSTFHLTQGSLTPPPGTPLGDDVTLTMLVEMDSSNNELVFTFGPSGSQFSPAAEIWFDYSDLGSTMATLYYIDSNGNHIPQQPDDVDLQGKRMKITVDHFSRYALAAD